MDVSFTETPQPERIYTKSEPARHEVNYPLFGEGIPSEKMSSGGYTLKFARSWSELDAALKLRFRVFNLELAEGLDESHVSGRDEDRFDATNHHMMVYHERSGHCVGTYRMQTADMADSGLGFYSAGEFDLGSVPQAVIRDSVEIGRACIAQGHRTIRVLHLLWRGLGLYLAHNNKRYLFGCCSLTSQDMDEGTAIFHHLRERNHLVEDWAVSPKPGYECVGSDQTGNSLSTLKVPRLMKAYLAQGAKICGPPAIDRAFKTIDYLALFDTTSMSRSALSYYRIRG